MRLRLLYILTFGLILIVCTFIVSCSDDDMFISSNAQVSKFSIVGSPVEAFLNISIEEFSVDALTRDEAPTQTNEEATQDEDRIDDIWVFEYDATYGSLINIPEHITITDQETLNNVPVTLADNEGAPVIIYVVTNAGSGVEENSENWVEGNQTTGWDGFMSIDDLKNKAIPTPHPQRMTFDGNDYVIDSRDADVVSIPMEGNSSDVVVKSYSQITIPVTRMFAKVLVRVDLSDFNGRDQTASLNELIIRNIPEYATVGTLWDNDKTSTAKPGDYSKCENWIQRRFNEIDDSAVSDEVYPYLIYVPENIQGENSNNSQDKADNVPNGYALISEASVNVIDENNVTLGPYTFIAYPGGNTTTNFNVRRNCIYRVTLVIGYPIAITALPSANCIICPSGETTAFWPYYREDTGGGYDFATYLDAYDETNVNNQNSKKIASVRIIWQRHSENNSSSGYIGNNYDNEYVWIDPQGSTEEEEFNRKIYVKIPEGEIGNALIGAYNASGVLLWSWHIWSRAKENDPTTVNVKLYYTYEWDNETIYGRDSNRPRVAGYTIMNCNLGALIDEPTSYTTVSDEEPGNIRLTFGMLYQWGRKDPFPPLVPLGSDYIGNRWCYYRHGDDGIGTYYDNSNSQVTARESTDTGYLFHSVAGTDRPTSIEDGLLASIQNPTVFYCGTNQAGFIDTNYSGVANGMTKEQVEEILQNNYPEPHDGNWLLDSEGNHFNRLWGGLDPENDGTLITKSLTVDTDILGNLITLYDDYGSKSIFDPCPYGWRVSPPDLWLGFTTTGYNMNDSFTDINYNPDRSNYWGMTMYLTQWRSGETSYFPIQGTRTPEAMGYRVAQCANYQNATADSNDRVNMLHIHNNEVNFKIFENSILAYYLKSTAGPVRCVRDSK